MPASTPAQLREEGGKRYQTSLLTAQDCRNHIHLILGSNPLAASRATQSLTAGAKPIIISPETPGNNTNLHYTLAAQIESGAVTYLPRPFQEQDLFTLGREDVNGVADAVFITSSSPGGGDESLTPQTISQLCKRNRIPVNVVDAPDLCSFSLLSVHVDGPLQIGVTTNGRGCKLASRIRREVAASLPVGLGEACDRLGNVRRRIVQEDAAVAVADNANKIKEQEVNEGVDDSVDQSASFNKLVTEEDAAANAKTRRMRWLSQICEYWPLKRLAGVTDSDVTAILESYHTNPNSSSSVSLTNGAATPIPKKTGLIILAGSGPGHPDLLTRATHKAILSADLILADKLVPSGVLNLIPRRTPVSIARKFPGNADRAQEELLSQALAAVSQGQTVLRLKQGDPFIYGRGGEEVEFFRQHGLGDRVVVLPGITSSLSAPLFAGIPATQRDVADQVLICTGTGKKGKAPVSPEYVGSRTVVFLMALHRIGGLVGELTKFTEEELGITNGEEAGEQNGAVSEPTRKLWPLDTPCAVIERASCPDQRVIRTTLRYVAEAIEQEGSRPPGLLVVGRACEALYKPEAHGIGGGGGKSWVVEDEGFKGLDLDDLLPGDMSGLAALS